ncbi:hypothetical protein WMY93_024258 [Mugilogobius chulae]|uniref:Uncharacterized protein n=1 Tax=Mugilogobius chulae TaxID=88201 RepID=A0AAW0N037_9GOBI
MFHSAASPWRSIAAFFTCPQKNSSNMAVEAGTHSFSRLSNIPFRLRNDPDQDIPTQKKDYGPLSCRRTEAFPKTAPALVTHKDTRIRQEPSEFTSSYPPHPLELKPRISSWMKLTTNFRLPLTPGEDGFRTTASDYRQHRPEPLESPRKHKLGGLFRSWAWTRKHLRRCTRTHPKIPTIKGDGRQHFVTDYIATFDRKPLTENPPVPQRLSSVSLGDKDRITEQQTTHSVSFSWPKVCSSPVLKSVRSSHWATRPHSPGPAPPEKPTDNIKQTRWCV